MNIQVCRDSSDATALYLPQRLYLKSFAKINISVQLPSHKVHGKSISNWELMEKLRKMILPDNFSVLKVSKHSSEVIRFDAELESRDNLDRVLARLEDRVVQLKEYPDQLKVRVCEAKSDFPSRHDWDSFFRDTTEMDEMKPGERPDTIHISNLPIRWFIHSRDQDEDALPSESLVKKIFEKFGSVRQVDIPVSDPYRMQMKAPMRGITTPPQEAALYFEIYVQFSEYVGFVRCMDALRGRKLLRKRDDIAEWCGIKVEFDKTKHMTDAAVKRRSIVRERLASRQKAKEDEERAEKERVAKREAKERQKYERSEREKLEKMREREERRKKKQLAKLMQSDNLDLNSKVAEEQRKLVKAQKKLQAIRLIEELFKRIELRPELQRNGNREQHYLPGERNARARIIDKFKRQQQDLLEEQRQNYNNALNGRIVIRSVLETKKPKRDSSISSESSDERARRSDRDNHKKIKTERLTTPEREMEYNKATAASLYSMQPYGFGYPFPCPPSYAYPPQTSMYYPVRGTYYPPPGEYRRPRGRGRGRGRNTRMPYFDGPDANHQYYRYFKKLTEGNPHSEHEDRTRGRSRESRSRSRSRRRSYSRSRSRSRRRSYTRSRSRSRRSRSRSRRSRSRSRRSRSYHSRSRSRSRSHRRSRSRSRRSRSRSTSRHDHDRSDSKKVVSPNQTEARRSRSWSQKKDDRVTAESPKDK
ncbi:hypothetical protein SFRURICE_015850 [Spodoptera frugiperda]|uniref:A-kinase anchor protein 17A isoform X1 n=2 Tax=Spodoptera frugiperda TaxID=7108 RepID=A0A9R0ENN8_SPOFR|nr:A-kinase anchor protein 17A isoform X1 [Spodoptera frugiperda]KAF9796868.1 hypothetical protein SFRURICE_015850 [Spodoptera frugiperda]